MDDELQKVKKMVRSLLISVKEGLTVRQLEQDYLEFEGKKFPFANFGFSNSRGFLQSLTDVVQFFRDETGEEKLKQVSDKSTIHIEKLVAKQKTDSRKKKSGKRAPFTRNTLHNFSTRGRRGGGNSRGGRLNQYGRNPQYSTNVGHFGPTPRPLAVQESRNWSVPPRFRRNYAPNLNEHYQHEEDQDDSDWERDFSEEQKTNQTTNRTPAFPETKHVQMSTSIEMKVIKSTVPDNLQNINCQNYEEVKQKKFETDGSRDLSVRGRIRQGAQRGRGISKSATMVQKSAKMTEIPHTEHQTDFGIKSQRSSDLVSGQVWIDPYEQYRSSNQHRSPHTSENQNDDEDKLHEHNTLSAQELEEECNISVSVQQKIRQVLGKAPKGLWANRLPIVYKQTFGQELPMRDYGFHSVIEFVSAMPHVVRVERPYEKGDWLLSDANKPKVDSTEYSNQQQQLASQMNSQKARAVSQGRPGDGISNKNLHELKESVRQVLQAHIDGVSLYQLPDMYEEMTGRVLDPQAFGHSDITSLLVFLSKNNVLEMKFIGPECSRLVAIPTPGVRRFDFLRDVYKPHSHEGQQEIKGKSQSLERLPFGVVGPGRCYPPANMSGIEKNATCEVHVSNVVTPGLFWIQKRGDIYALDNLMDDLETVYDKAGDLYRMPLDLMLHGQVCAALYSDSNWHRGIITGVSGDRVQVYYVDYGDTCYVTPSAICFLKEKFLSLPVQAIQAKLAFLLPPAGEQTFSKKSKDVMLEMVMERALLAMIANIDNLGVSLVLVDTRKEDVFINDHLVNHGLARFQEDIGVETEASSVAQDGHGHKAKTHSHGEARRYVRSLEFNPDIDFNLIYLGGMVYVVSSEIACLFWEEDVLAFMLQQKNIVLQTVTVSRQQCPALFIELTRHGAFFMDRTVKLLNLYPLESLPMLLDLFGDQSQIAEGLKVFIKHYLDTFDHNDPYWKGADEETVSVSGSTGTTDDGDADPEDILTLEELQMALRSMQITRKRLLRKMTTEAEDMSDYVRELETTEDSIAQIQDLVRALEEEHTTDVKLTGKALSKPATCSTTTGPPDSQRPTSVPCETHAQDQRNTVKTNVVTPMIQPSPPSSTAVTTSAVHNPPQMDLLPESLELLAANQRLMAEIQQKDQMISSMLGVGDASGDALKLGIPPLPGLGGAGLGFPWMDSSSLQRLPAQPQSHQKPVNQTSDLPLISHNPRLPLLNQNPALCSQLPLCNPDQSQATPNFSQLPQNLPHSDNSRYLHMFNNPIALKTSQAEGLSYPTMFQNPGLSQDVGAVETAVPSQTTGQSADSYDPYADNDVQPSHARAVPDQGLADPQNETMYAYQEENYATAQVARQAHKMVDPDQELQDQTQESVGLPQAAGNAMSSLLSVPLVGVVRPHPVAYPPLPQDIRPFLQPGVCPPRGYPAPHPHQQFPMPGLMPMPISHSSRMPLHPSWLTPGPAAFQNISQQQHRQRLLQQQVMMRPESVGGGIPPSLLSSDIPGVPPVSSRAAGDGGEQGKGELLPGMMPLLQSFQASGGVQAATVPSSFSSSGMPGSQS